MKFVLLLLILATLSFSKEITNSKKYTQPLSHNHKTQSFTKKHSSTIGGPYNSGSFSTGYNNYGNRSYSSSSSSKNKKGSSVFFDVVFGGALFIGMVSMLWYNERRFVKTQKRLKQAFQECQELNPLEINPNTDQKLVHASGHSQSQIFIFDPFYAVNVSNSIKLMRVCEMYQVQEIERTRREKINGREYDETYFEYQEGWFSHYIDSSHFRGNSFGRYNDRRLFLSESESFFSQDVSFGAFKMSQSQKEQCNKQLDVLPQQDILQTAYSNNRFHRNVRIQGNYLYFSVNEFGQNLGDFRVSFKRVPCGELSIISKQTGNTFQPWSFSQNLGKNLDDSSSSDEEGRSGNKGLDISSQGCCCCCGMICKLCKLANKQIHDIDWVEESNSSMSQMFKSKFGNEKLRTSIQRVLGWILLCISIWLMLSPIYSLLYWFPFVGKLLGSIGSFICGLIGLILGSLLSLLVIGISWIWYRPAIGIAFVSISLAGFAFILYAHSQAQ